MKQDQDCLSGHGEKIHFSKGQTLFYQGHNPCGIFWIGKGKVSLVHIDQGQEHSEYKEDGVILGMEELMKGEALMYTAIASTDCDVLFIAKAAFTGWLGQYTHLI